MTSESRREFIKGIAAAGVGAASGCRSLFGGSFYGATIRDRLWMWGHHPDMSSRSVAKGAVWPGSAVDQAEGCRIMGIPNMHLFIIADLLLDVGYYAFATKATISALTEAVSQASWQKCDFCSN